ncbi:MAG: redoxin domain-containing protein [bacterium]
MVYDERDQPVRGAQLHSGDWDKELELYPDNYLAYRDKWMYESYDKGEEALKTVKQHLDSLKAIEDLTPQLLYIFSYGHLLLGEEREGRSFLTKLCTKYPHHPILRYAFSSYEYQTYSQGIKGEGPEEVKLLKLDLMRRFPDTKVARENLRQVASDSSADVEMIEEVAKRWMEDQPDHPYPYYVLAKTYEWRGKNLEEAENLITEAINLALKGMVRLYEDVSGQISDPQLSTFYEIRGKIRQKKNDFAGALADICAAIDIIPERWEDPGLYEFKASLWDDLGFSGKVENNYFLALSKGSEKAQEKLLHFYEKRYGPDEGFEDYLKERLAELTAKEEEKYPEAPDFELEDIEGRKVKLSDMRGKVVVLNFWHTGCAPCKVEIPALNKLVEEFEGKEVTFLAISFQGRGHLERFLKKHPFSYRILHSGKKVVSLYKVWGYPVHVVIDKKGRIRYQRSGASEHITDELHPLITQALGD